jgi:hypothetical protein
MSRHEDGVRTDRIGGGVPSAAELLTAELPDGYPRDRERRRKNLIRLNVFVMIGSGAASSITDWVTASVVASLIGFVVIAQLVRRFRILRATALGAGDVLTTNGLLPAWVARAVDQPVSPSVKDSIEFVGRIAITPVKIEWTPTARSARMGCTVLTIDRSQIAQLSVTPVRSLVPLALVQVVLETGAQLDIWIRSLAESVAKSLTASAR